MTQVNPKVSNIALNAKGGALTNITLTIMASKVEVIEDPNFNGGVQQGLTGFYIDTQPPQSTLIPSPAQQQTWLPANNGQTGHAYEPIIFGGTDGRVHGGEGNYVGAQGTVILQLTTNSENPGGVLLVEWP
jgi:hypothetical protein